MKNIAILGSTGSIGTQTLDVIRNNPEEFRVIALSANSNIEVLREQIKEFKPLAVAVMDKEKAEELKEKVELNVFSGINGLVKISTMKEADTLVTAVVGSIGLKPTIEAIKHKKGIALANKETLVTAGSLVMNQAKKSNVNIMPIDSEHSAILQCINGESSKEIKKIILTCSGGAFRNHTAEQLKRVKAGDALKHPTWNMGAKTTIDSATLMNKGFEVIEAHWLYNIDYENIDVIIHQQSIIHSMVEFIDNSIKAQLGIADMKIPIQYALSFPKRTKSRFNNSLDLLKNNSLTFSGVNTEAFPCLDYAYKAGKTGGTMPAALNAANEVAVEYFLKDKISFLDIPVIIRRMLDEHTLIKKPELDDILYSDKEIRVKTRDLIQKEYRK